MSAKFVVIHPIVACVIRGNHPLVLCCSESQCRSAGTNQQICNSYVNSPTSGIKCHCHQKKMMSANCKKVVLRSEARVTSSGLAFVSTFASDKHDVHEYVGSAY